MENIVYGAVFAFLGSLWITDPKPIEAIPEDNCTYHVECRPQCTVDTEAIQATIVTGFANYDGTCYCDDVPDCEEAKDCAVHYTVTITPLPGECHDTNDGHTHTSQYTFTLYSNPVHEAGCAAEKYKLIDVHDNLTCAQPEDYIAQVVAECNRLVLERCDQRSCQ